MFKKNRKNRKKVIKSDLGKFRKSRKKTKRINFRKIIFKIVFYVFLMAFLFGIPYFIFVRDFLKIKKIEVFGVSRISSVQIQEELEEIKDQKWFNFIPKDNIIFPWNKMIRKEMFSRYPVFKNIKVQRKLPDTVKVFFEERSPKLIQKTKEKSCVFDENGEFFDVIQGESYLGDSNIKIIRLSGGNHFEKCFENFEKDYLDFILVLDEKIENDLGIKLVRFWETPNVASGDLRVETEEGWKIFLDKNIGIKKEFEMFALLLENKINETERQNLEYIDLRTQNRVYYKLKNNGENIEEKKDDEKT